MSSPPLALSGAMQALRDDLISLSPRRGQGEGHIELGSTLAVARQLYTAVKTAIGVLFP
jgi:hypothetical protein